MVQRAEVPEAGEEAEEERVEDEDVGQAERQAQRHRTERDAFAESGGGGSSGGPHSRCAYVVVVDFILIDISELGPCVPLWRLALI